MASWSKQALRDMPRTPMPRFCADLAYELHLIPNPSEPTVGGKEVVRLGTMPDRYEYDYPGKVLEVQPAKVQAGKRYSRHNKYALPTRQQGRRID
jgi:hypothetical protein